MWPEKAVRGEVLFLINPRPLQDSRSSTKSGRQGRGCGPVLAAPRLSTVSGSQAADRGGGSGSSWWWVECLQREESDNGQSVLRR